MKQISVERKAIFNKYSKYLRWEQTISFMIEIEIFFFGTCLFVHVKLNLLMAMKKQSTKYIAIFIFFFSILFLWIVFVLFLAKEHSITKQTIITNVFIFQHQQTKSRKRGFGKFLFARKIAFYSMAQTREKKYEEERHRP